MTAKADIGTRRPLSLHGRVMLFVAFAIGLSFLLIGYLILDSVERHFAEQDADELIVITHAVEQALQLAAEQSIAPEESLRLAVSGHHGVYFQVWDEAGRQIYGPKASPSPEAGTYASVDRVEADNLYTWQSAGETYRGTVTRTLIGTSEYRIVAAISMDFHMQFLESFQRSLWIIMIAAAVFTLAAAWFGVHQGHAPLRGLSETMTKIQADRLHVRLEPDTVPLELKTLVNSFNHMISRLEDSFVRLTDFSADIAHELRTPLTNLITQTQVSLGKSRSAEEYRELLYSNLEEQERLTKMVNDMLWLAQSDHGLLKPQRELLELDQEVRDLFDFFEALAEEAHVELRLEGQAPATNADRAMLRRALSNLISNAIRHTPSGGRIFVQLGRSASGETQLSIQNPGDGIPPEHLPRIFDRFYRIDPSRQHHNVGLGLATVKSIVEAHAGTIEVTSGQGKTTFTISIPACGKAQGKKSRIS